MTYHQPGSAGTAGRDYRLDDADHDFTPERPEYGRRDVCAHCHREHLPQPRRATA
jgi:hypothetical protein